MTKEQEPEAPADRALSADGAGDPAAQMSLSQAIEAMVVSMDKPVNASKIAGALVQCGMIETADDPGLATKIANVIEQLNETYDNADRAFRIEPVAGGWRVMTRAVFAPAVMALHQSRGARTSNRLSKAAMETLAVVAYRQPATRATLESIRGVACGEVLKTLMDKRLVTIKGRAEELGRPMLYGTTKEFLDTFGLASVKDLPDVTDLAPPEPRIEKQTPPQEPPQDPQQEPPSDQPVNQAIQTSPAEDGETLLGEQAEQQEDGQGAEQTTAGAGSETDEKQDANSTAD